MDDIDRYGYVYILYSESLYPQRDPLVPVKWSRTGRGDSLASPPPGAVPDGPLPQVTVRRLRLGTKGELLVALPRGWATGDPIQPGESLLISSLGEGRLLLTRPGTGRPSSRSEVRLEPTEPPEHGFRRLVAAYLAGASELVLRAEPGQVREILPEFLRRTSHLEVLGDSGPEGVIRDVSEGLPPSFPALLRRMFQLVTELQRSAGELLAGGPAEPTLERRDDDIDRLAWLIQRRHLQELRAHLGAGRSGDAGSFGLPYLAASRALERIADHAVRLSEAAARLPGGALPAGFRSSLVQLHRQTLASLGEAQDLLEDPEPGRANRLIDATEGIRVARHTLWERLLGHRAIGRFPEPCLVPLALILESVDRTAAYVTDLAEVALDWSAERSLSSPSLPASPAPPAISMPSPHRGKRRKERP
jgi:phosphate uptake regulator